MMVEIELWINTANRTNGNLYGYDEDIRFVAGIDAVKDFYDSFYNELDSALMRA